MAKYCNEGAAAKQRRSGLEGRRLETRCQQVLLTAKSLLKSTHLLVICTTIQYQFMCEMYWLTVHLIYM